MKNKINEKGGALILALILMLVLSVMAASMMFLSQSETWASMNYRLMTQSRYAAETGIHAAANYLMFTYVPPDSIAIGAYDYQTKSPVTLLGGTSDVLLTSISGDTPVYADQATIYNFGTRTRGTLPAGATTLNFNASAKLLAMRQVQVYGKTQPATVQTWLLKGQGSIVNVQNSQVEVSAVMERLVTPMFAYAAFASSPGCGALNFGGGGTTNSYDSGTLLANGGTLAAPVITLTGGNVGTNGNLATVGTTTVINGSLSTPRAGVGVCSAGTVTAFSGSGAVSGGIIELPQPVSYPPPDPPNPMPPTGNLRLNNGACTYVGCTGNAGVYFLAPGTPTGTLPGPALYPDVIVQGDVHLSAGVYNMNSLTIAGAGARIIIDSGPVIVNIAGVGFATNQAPIDFTGGSISNPSLNPANFQIQYAGTSLVKLTGGAASSALIYAPNASAGFTGGGDFYGSVIVNQLTDMGGAAVHYDRRLQNMLFNLGNWMLDSFTWSKF